jgi:hypothetical protein
VGGRRDRCVYSTGLADTIEVEVEVEVNVEIEMKAQSRAPSKSFLLFSTIDQPTQPIF